MAHKNRRSRIPYALQIIIILGIGALASLLILVIGRTHGHKETENNTKPSDADIAAVEAYEKEDRTAHASESYKVTFLHDNGTVLEEKTVKYGYGVIPPIFETEGVFRGWNKPINYVTCNIETQPLVYDIVETNLFYFDSVYVREGTSFTLPLKVSGDVAVCSGRIELNYDPEVMDYIEDVSVDFCEVKKGKTGQLIITFDSNENLTEETELSQLSFFAKEKEVQQTRISLKAADTLVLQNGERISADNATVNNNIYYLQEVG